MRPGVWPELTSDELGRLTEEQIERFGRYEYRGCDVARIWRPPTAEERRLWNEQLDAEGWPPRSGSA